MSAQQNDGQVRSERPSEATGKHTVRSPETGRAVVRPPEGTKDDVRSPERAKDVFFENDYLNGE